MDDACRAGWAYAHVDPRRTCHFWRRGDRLSLCTRYRDDGGWTWLATGELLPAGARHCPQCSDAYQRAWQEGCARA